MPTRFEHRQADRGQLDGETCGQRPSADRFERRHLVEVDRRSPDRGGLEAEVGVGAELVGGQRLGHGVGLVERHHLRAVLAQLAADRALRSCSARRTGRPRPRSSATRVGRRPQAFTLADGDDAGTGAGLWPITRSRARDRIVAAHAVGGQATVGLELDERSCGDRTEDAVDPTAVEAEPAEPGLQFGDVVAAQVR